MRLSTCRALARFGIGGRLHRLVERPCQTAGSFNFGAAPCSTATCMSSFLRASAADVYAAHWMQRRASLYTDSTDSGRPVTSLPMTGFGNCSG